MSTTTTAKPLTARQQAVLEWIADHISSLGYGPTVREVAGHFHMTPGGAVCHLRALRKKQLVQWEKGQARSIRTTGGAE